MYTTFLLVCSTCDPSVHNNLDTLLTFHLLFKCAFLSQIKSVLEAVNILLSDSSSPFVCMIAVDSRIAVKCIEEGMGSALLKANVTGHEYLKKIINLPFCLPEVSSLQKNKQFVKYYWTR